jgi:hypothetical protein
MKAAQDRFVASLPDDPVEPEKEATEASRSTREKAEAGESFHEESTGTACALCRDSGSESPLCFLTLVQVRVNRGRLGRFCIQLFSRCPRAEKLFCIHFRRNYS